MRNWREAAQRNREGILVTDPTREREDSLSQLRPCPFCGGEAYYTESVNGSQMAYVGCTVCGISAKAARTGHNLTDWTKDLKLMWNTRASVYSIVKAAFEACANEAARSVHAARCNGWFDPTTRSSFDTEGILVRNIRALPPESAILGAQITELEARLEEAEWWIGYFGEDNNRPKRKRVLEYESQLSALKAKREGGAKK